MAIIKCKECGQEISSKARVCPHCGIRNPAPFGFTFKRLLKIWSVCFVVLVVFVVIIVSVSGGGSDTSSTASSAGRPSATDGEASDSSTPPPVFAGSQGKVVHLAMACPMKSDIQTFDNSYAQAVNVHDTVGQRDAITAAHQAGCETVPPEVRGLVIDNSGFALPLDELRLPDGGALWFNAGAIGPLNYGEEPLFTGKQGKTIMSDAGCPSSAGLTALQEKEAQENADTAQQNIDMKEAACTLVPSGIVVPIISNTGNFLEIKLPTGNAVWVNAGILVPTTN